MSSLRRLGAVRRGACLAACALLAACSTYGPVSLPHPQPSPSTGLVVTPNALSLSPGNGASIAANESGYNGSFKESDNCSGIATVTALSSSQFAVSAVSPGTCAVSVSDTAGNAASVAVSVQTVVIGGQ